MLETIIVGVAAWIVGLAMGLHNADKNAAKRGWLSHEDTIYTVSQRTYWTPQIATKHPEGPKPPARD